MHILIAEDELDMQKILKLYLQKEGYQVSVVSNGREAVDFLYDCPADLVLLDWMMPVQDGIETCKEIRLMGIPVKILMLTARGQNRDEVAGLSCGADDYLRKPFDMEVLLLRVNKLCQAENVLRFREVMLNQDTMEVTKQNGKVALTKTEFELLRIFLKNQRIVLSRDTLLNHVWGMDFDGDARTVDTHIRRLRKKIGEDYIKTRVGMGYVMEEPS